MELTTNHPAGHYLLHGIAIEVAWDDAGVAEAVDAVLKYFGFSRSSDAVAEAQVRVAFLTQGPPPDVPKGARQVAAHNGVDVWHAGAHLYFCEGATVVALHPASGSGCAVLRTPMRTGAGLLRPAFVNLVIHSLLVLLRRHAYYPLHAAGLAKEGLGLLLVADSGSGKSTQALSLVQAGWQYLSDDSLLLRPAEAGVMALPLRREFGLDDEVTGRFPEMAAHGRRYLTRERKQRIDMAALYPEQALDACLPRVLLFPEIVSAPQSRLLSVSREEAMGELLRQSPLLMLDAEMAAAHIDVLEQLVDQAVACRLHAGRDLKEHPSLLGPLLAPLLQPSAVCNDTPM